MRDHLRGSIGRCQTPTQLTCGIVGLRLRHSRCRLCSVKVLCCILQWLRKLQWLRHLPRGPLPIEYLFLGTAGPNHWFLAPVGATSSMPWAQAHGPQAADAPAASSWLTKEENSYRAATGGSSMAWIQRRLDGTSCVGELCARRPARKLVRDRGLAPTAFKMSPLSGLNSHSS